MEKTCYVREKTCYVQIFGTVLILFWEGTKPGQILTAMAQMVDLKTTHVFNTYAQFPF